MAALAVLLCGCGSRGLANGASGTGTSGGPTPQLTGRTLTATFLDIGQGDSAVVQTPSGKTILIDAGLPGSETVILDFLKRHNIPRLDYVAASHPHNDHIGGMAGVLRSVPFGPVIDAAFPTGSQVQERFLSTIKAQGGSITPGRAGKRLSLDNDVNMDILAPSEPLFTANDPDWINNNSVVVRFTFGKTHLLFTGDMEEAERERLYATGADLRADVLKAAHHGSRNGTDATFLQRVHPQVAVLSCGQGNDYGHPHEEALQALHAAGVPFHRTDLEGTVTVTCDDQGRVNVQTERSATAEALDQPGTGGHGEHGRGGIARRRPRAGVGGETGRLPVSVETSAPLSNSSEAFIGNSRTHVYHAAGASDLPALRNRVYFRTRAEAEAAGYRPARDAGP